MKIAVIPALLLTAAGCRSYLSYVPLEPQSPGWAVAADGGPGDVVWSVEGVTIRAYAAEHFGAGFGGTGNSDLTPDTIEMKFVVTNNGPGPLVVGAAPGDPDAVTAVDKIEVLSGRDAFVVHGPDDLARIDWSAGLPQWSHDGDVREVAFRVRFVARHWQATERKLPIQMRIRQGDTDIDCPAHFVARGCARESHWYTVPLDGVVYAGEACTFVASIPLCLIGYGPIYSP